MNYKIFYHLNSYKIFLYLFLACFIFQIAFWQRTQNIKPPFEIVPPAPNKIITSALSLGDDEFLFRVLGMRLQNSGDVFAGFLALKEYNYSRIYDWMSALDKLNEKSNFVPALASYYYSQTQNHQDTIYIVNYLEEHALKNIDNYHNWWWMLQAAYIAKSKLKDDKKALDLSYKVASSKDKDAPLWSKQMPAFFHEQSGEGCLAFNVIDKLIKESENGKRQIDSEEMDLMRHFIKDRLKKLENGKFNPKKCRLKK